MVGERKQELQELSGFKSIPPQRARMQSDLLVGVCGMLLVLKAAILNLTLLRAGMLPLRLWIAWAISGLLALVVWRLRAATVPAAMLGSLICWHMLAAQVQGSSWTRTATPSLLLLFVLTFLATHFGRRQKERLGVAEQRTGRRASQIVANLGVAGLCAGAASPLLFLACVAALAEATADTVSSEMGQVLGGRTILMTTGQNVPPGTNGGVSLFGTLLGMASALVVTSVAALTRPLSTPVSILVFCSAVAGLLIDSLLGATVERRGWLGNDLVNFSSTVMAAALAYSVTRLLG